MAAIDLPTLLQLVGPLVDSTEAGSASARFREYLEKNVRTAAEIREYVQAALSQKGESFSFAFQDIVNHIGRLLGFKIQFGRYRGVAGQLGFDGFWKSPTSRDIVVEVKTTDTYSVSTEKLLGYINGLISSGEIRDRHRALGLYVYGRFDAQTSQLEKAISAEHREQELRVISAEALVGLLELAQEYELDHESVLTILFPSEIRVDSVVDLVLDIVAEEKKESIEIAAPERHEPIPPAESEGGYFLLPAAESEDGTPTMANLHRWLDRKMWGFGERTRHRRNFRAGDRFCFFAKGIGIVAEAIAESAVFELESKDSPVQHPVPYGIRLRDVRWFDSPIKITLELRARLSAFSGRDLSKGWAWFVQTTSRLRRQDFEILTNAIR